MSGGFLILIIAIVLSMTSSGSKKRKKTHREVAVPPIFDMDEVHTPQEEFSLEEVLDEIKNEWLPKEDPNKEIVLSLPEKEIKFDVEPEMPIIAAPSIKSPISEPVKKTQNSDKYKERDRISKSQRDNSSVDADEFLSEFDLRKAVIYSEILSPKYKEY